MKIQIRKNRADSLLLTFLLTLVSLTVAPMPCHAQEPREEVLYQENFNNGQAQGWNLQQPAWEVEGHYLYGRNHTWARYTQGHWYDSHVTFKLTTNGMHANVRVSEQGRYAVGFRKNDRSRLSLYLFKQVGAEFFNNLAVKPTEYNDRDELHVKITTIGGRIQVSVNRRPMIDYTDPDPLPHGTIAFETLENSFAMVDDVVVIGVSVKESGRWPEPQPEPQPEPRPGFRPEPQPEPRPEPRPGFRPEPQPEPRPERRPDLFLSRVNSVIDKERQQLVITTKVENAGNAPAPPALLLATAHGWANEAIIHQLDTGGIGEVRIELNITDNQRNRMHRFEVLVDPENTIEEWRENNNRQVIDVWVPELRREEPERRPDLFLSRVNSAIDKERQKLVITAKVENVGNAPAPPTIVLATTPGWANEVIIHQLDTGGIDEVRIGLNITDNQRNRMHRFEVLVDPKNSTKEWREDNNRQLMDVMVPGLDPPSGGFSLSWEWAGIAVLLLGLGIATGRALMLRPRQTWERTAQLQWQLEATRDLPEPKEACTWACKVKTKTELLKRWKIAALQLTPLPLPSGKTPRIKRVEGKVLDRLTEAAQPQYILEDKARLRKCVAPVVEALLEQIFSWKKEGQTPASIKVDAHLVRDIKCEFKLFHCENTINGLDWVDSRVKWKGTLHQPGGEFLDTLRGPMADEPDFTNRARVELEGFLLQLVKGVRFKL